MGRIEVPQAKPDDPTLGRESIATINDSYLRSMVEECHKGWNEGIEQSKQRLMRHVQQIQDATLPNDSEILSELLGVIDSYLYSPVEKVESEKKLKLWQEGKRKSKYDPLTPKEGAVLSKQERQTLEDTFSRIKDAGWQLYKDSRLKEGDASDPETPPAPPVGIRLKSYLKAMLDFKHPEDPEQRLQKLLQSARLVLDNDLPETDPNVYSGGTGIAHYLKNARNVAEGKLFRNRDAFARWEKSGGGNIVHQAIKKAAARSVELQQKS